MEDDALIRMANQIAAHFEDLPHEEAVAEIAGHIRRFWEPRMRRGLARILAVEGHALQPLAREAAARLAEAAEPGGAGREGAREQPGRVPA